MAAQRRSGKKQSVRSSFVIAYPRSGEVHPFYTTPLRLSSFRLCHQSLGSLEFLQKLCWICFLFFFPVWRFGIVLILDIFVALHGVLGFLAW